MTSIPPMPTFEEAADALVADGHLWLQELVEGLDVVVRLETSGRLAFDPLEGDAQGPWPSLRVQAGVRHVRERFDRGRFREAVDDVADHRFVGRMTFRRSIDYDWSRLPPFLGLEIWPAGESRPMPPDAAERAFRSLGLEPVNAIRKELPARDFDPADHATPDSAWYDGPAAGLVIRTKTGERAVLRTSAGPGGDGDGPVASDLRTHVLEHVTPERVDRVLGPSSASRRSGAEDPVEQVLTAIARETTHPAFAEADLPDRRSIRSTIAERLARMDRLGA